MKASKSVIATSILTTLLLVGGGTVAAYADEGTPTESQEVTSSPESTSMDTQSQTKPGSITTEVATTTTTDAQDTPGPDTSVEPSQPTASSDDGPSPSESGATENTSGSQTPSTPTTENPVAASAPKASDKGNGHTPVLICHKGYQDLTVDDNAVAAHLAHGDTLGACPPLTGGGPAPYPSDPDQVEIWWALPWPGNAQNVTWPQAYASSTNLQCSITYQVDTYLKSEAQKFTLDGVLNLGEDYQNDTQRGAISWRFVYGGDCATSIPPKPDDTRRLLDSHDTTDCEGKTVTHIETYEVTTYVYNEQHMTWVANIGPVTTETPREATEEECPVNMSVPVTTPTTGSIAPTTPNHAVGRIGAEHGTTSNVAPGQPTRSLAKTGDNGALIAFLVVLGLLFLVLGTAAVVSTRRRN